MPTQDDGECGMYHKVWTITGTVILISDYKAIFSLQPLSSPTKFCELIIAVVDEVDETFVLRGIHF